jgi:hypothetical protein
VSSGGVGMNWRTNGLTVVLVVASDGRGRPRAAAETKAQEIFRRGAQGDLRYQAGIRRELAIPMGIRTGIRVRFLGFLTVWMVTGGMTSGFAQQADSGVRSWGPSSILRAALFLEPRSSSPRAAARRLRVAAWRLRAVARRLPKAARRLQGWRRRLFRPSRRPRPTRAARFDSIASSRARTRCGRIRRLSAEQRTCQRWSACAGNAAHRVGAREHDAGGHSH